MSPNALSYGADGYDVVDSTPDPHRTKQAIAQLQQKILKLEATPLGTTPERMREMIQQSQSTWEPVVKAANIQPE